MFVWVVYENRPARRSAIWADGYISNPTLGTRRPDELFQTQFECEIKTTCGVSPTEMDLRLAICKPAFGQSPKTSFDYELYSHRSADYRVLVLTFPVGEVMPLPDRIKSSLVSLGFRSGRDYRNYWKFRDESKEILRTITNFYSEPELRMKAYLKEMGFTMRISK